MWKQLKRLQGMFVNLGQFCNSRAQGVKDEIAFYTVKLKRFARKNMRRMPNPLRYWIDLIIDVYFPPGTFQPGDRRIVRGGKWDGWCKLEDAEKGGRHLTLPLDGPSFVGNIAGAQAHVDNFVNNQMREYMHEIDSYDGQGGDPEFEVRPNSVFAYYVNQNLHNGLPVQLNPMGNSKPLKWPLLRYSAVIHESAHDQLPFCVPRQFFLYTLTAARNDQPIVSLPSKKKMDAKHPQLWEFVATNGDKRLFKKKTTAPKIGHELELDQKPKSTVLAKIVNKVVV